MDVKKLVVGSLQVNCCFIVNDKKCIIVDPGADAGRIIGFMDRNEYEPVAIFLTHGHFDHIMAVNELKEKYNINVYAAKPEAALLEDASLNCSVHFGRKYETSADVLLKDGQEIDVAGVHIKVIFTPGHTAGSCCYYIKDEKILLSGDTLFYGSIGRTDLPTGDEDELLESLFMLMRLPEDVKVYCGHGPETSIGFEKEHNPYYNPNIRG